MKTLLAILPILFCTVSCGGEPTTPAVMVPADLFVTAAPDGAVGVTAARANAAVGSDVVLRGTMGGRKAPFGGSSATFVVIDASLEPCPADEGCETPWDCCCQPGDEIAANSATVQVVDATGRVLPVGVDGTGGLAPMAQVVVAGKVRAIEGGLVVDAERIHVVR